MNAIYDTVSNKNLYVLNPKTNFTRDKKLPFKECLKLILSMGANSLDAELLKFTFNKGFSLSTAAFIQQRRKIKIDAFKNIFNKFLSTVDNPKTYKGYRVIAADGSDIQIPYNKCDINTYRNNGESKKGWNLLHLNALYDILNKIYVSIEINSGSKKGEALSLINMAKDVTEKSILIADRGYCTYNVLQAFQETKQLYLIRAMEPKSNHGIIGNLSILEDSQDEIVQINVKKVRSHHNKVSGSKKGDIFYKIVNGKLCFSNLQDEEEYTFKIRVIKYQLISGEEEYLITNLPKEKFSYEEIVKLYNSRWGIETSFRDLKYSLGLLSFHSKKADYVMQEIYAKIIMYNYSSLITQKTIIPNNKDNKLKINFKMAIQICIHYFRSTDNLQNIEELLLSHIYSTRPGRVFERNKHRRDPIFFNYRLS